MQDTIITHEMIPDLPGVLIVDCPMREQTRKNRLYIKELKKLRKTMLKASVVFPADLLTVLQLCDELSSQTGANIKPPKLKKFNNKELIKVIAYLDECVSISEGHLHAVAFLGK